MVISANGKFNVFHNEYAAFLELFNVQAFQTFTSRTQQKVVVYDVASREYYFVSDGLNSNPQDVFSVDGQLFTAWACLGDASLRMMKNELLPMMLDICKIHSEDLSKLRFEATVQLKDMSWHLLHSYPLSLNKHQTSALVCSVLDNAPIVSKSARLQCSAYKEEGIHVELLQSQGEEADCVKALGLSRRELEVLRFLCKGKTSRAISEQLFVSFETVKKHRQNILEKTGCKNTVELMNLAMSLGII